MSLIRDDSIFISWQSRKGLSYCLTEECSTVDGLADKIIADWLKANHPTVVEHMRSQAEADKAFKESRKIT